MNLNREGWVDLAFIIFLICCGVTMVMGGIAFIIAAINGF